MRIDKLLANSGYGSRKEVKKLLKQGVVKANGTILKSGAAHVDPETMEIMIQGERLVYKKYVYLMMNKPQGVISATEDNVHRTVIDLLESEDAVRSPFPVGRLDKDTVGLLLLTNDGKFAHTLTSPKKEVPKTYEALLSKGITAEDIEVFSKGIMLDDGYVTKPARLRKKEEDAAEILLTITEGKFHQVKRMFEARGNKVLFLKRVQVGNVRIDDDLKRGEYRDLTEEEIEMLWEEAGRE
ncbi:pseudouridine synthase [Bacillus piscicola]|uniref:pseudouridine synthase n=1 Tax=Bacillus piscicola TaxID=1632684 RepID=UPI001F09A9DB|nr:pseudouridine synthase [Bacillus piscicola]